MGARVCKESDNVHQTMQGRRIDSRRAMSTPGMPTRASATETMPTHTGTKSTQTMANQAKATQTPLVQDKVILSSSKGSHYTDIEVGFSATMGDEQYKKCVLDELKGTYTLSGGPSTGTGYTYTNKHGAFIQINIR